MPNKIAHFAIEADDVERAAAFYADVFGWSFKQWGPPNFYLINGAGLHGALQARTARPEKGRKGFECSIAVDDLRASMEKIDKAGGRILADVYTIPAVGDLATFEDTEGNEAIVIQYTPERSKEIGLS